jgi:hypothetical protein
MYNTDLPTRAELPSSRQLIRSTLMAVVAAGALLSAVVMPAEYGIDPTGIGGALGLKKMGEIKVALAKEAKQEAPPPAANMASPKAGAQAAQTVPAAAAAPLPAEKPAAAGLAHETRVTLKPGQAAEIKLDMRKGAKVRFEWTTAGGPVNFDNHGDPPNAPKGFYHGYAKGRQVERDAGEIEAAFDGKHGFYWRNRSGNDVTVNLKTQGEYSALKRVL